MLIYRRCVSNVKAIATRKFGFKNVTLEKDYSNGEDAYLMIKELRDREMSGYY